jgi:F-type H+-transporting ATPase subunit epsilon
MDASGHKTLKCVIVTPERTVLDETVEFVALPLIDGELGVLPQRAPLTGRLGYGELRTTYHGSTRHYYVEGGFVQVNHDVVSVLTPKAVAVGELDAGTLGKQLASATGQAAAKLKAQLHLATKGGPGASH